MTENLGTTCMQLSKRSSRLACPAKLKSAEIHRPSRRPLQELRIENTLIDEGGQRGLFEAGSHRGDHSQGRGAGVSTK
jgi:hypothetical protein